MNSEAYPMKKVMLVFGTRPEAIKMAPLVKAFQADREHFKTVVCVTGQHREMLDQVLKLFGIVPQYDLHVMKQGQDLYDVTARILIKMRDVLRAEHPDLVLVHGDTTTSAAAALAAFYQQVQVGHVEAGLRTYDTESPWPEEMNRQLTARMASWHFAPTSLCRSNLLRENIPAAHIFVTGNTVVDALHCIVRQRHMALGTPSGRRVVLVTCHRRENFGQGLKSICQAVKTLALNYPDVDFVCPVHPNPHVRQTVAEMFDRHGDGAGECPNLHFPEPLEYADFVALLSRCTIVLTDSGGIQEEAPGLGKPVLVMRDTTERPEAVQAGTVKLVGTDSGRIVAEASRLLDDPVAYRAMSRAVNPYGDGTACQQILQIIRHDILP